MTTPNFIFTPSVGRSAKRKSGSAQHGVMTARQIPSLPNNPVFLNDGVRQNFFREFLQLVALSVLQLHVKDLSLTHGGDVREAKRCDAALNGHTLGVQNSWFQ